MLGDVLFVPLALWVIVAALSCFGVYLAQRPRPPVTARTFEPAVVIIPVRGVPAHLGALWQALSTQSYSPIRVVFVVESETDPAHTALRALSGGPPVEVVVARLATKRGQKIHNMLTGLERLQPGDAMVIFSDADMAPDADWLARLTRDLEGRQTP